MNGVNYGEIVTYILETVLAILIPALAALAFTEGRKALAYAKANWWAKLNAQQQAQVQAIATLAVHMAEQIASRDDVKDAAKAKFDMANAYMNQQLARYGITLTAQEVEAQIEAAVSQQFNQPPMTELSAVEQKAS